MAGTLLIKNGILALPGGPSRADILCEAGRIVAVGANLVAPGAPSFDAHGLTVGPGFVDVHVHGGGGFSFFTGEPADVLGYAEWAPRAGVTSFLVTTVGPNEDETRAMLRRLAAVVGQGIAAEPLGIHLEGPFINPERCGAFHPDTLRDASREEFWRYQDAAGGAIRLATLAPEIPGGIELTSAIVASGAAASMGHTDATMAETRTAFEAGVGHVTHLFNAMRRLHHRDGGVAAAALLEDSVTCEVICDGVHVAPEMMRLAYRMLGPHRFVAITDNLSLAGAPALQTSFAGAPATVAGLVARRGDGTIVGSVALMDRQFRNILAILGVDLAAAFRMCATNPARVAGAAGRKGGLAHGFDADVVLLDGDFEVAATVCRGRVAYLRDAARAPWMAAVA